MSVVEPFRRGVAFVVATALVATAACGRDRDVAPAPTAAVLGGGVAQVGDIPIPKVLVEQTASARAQTPRAALNDLIDDALAAQGARAAGLDASARVDWASNAALARVVSERLQERARAAGPPRDEELANLRVVHAVVMRSRLLPEPNAIAIANDIRRAVLAASSADDFVARANAVPHGRAVVRVESISPFDAAGRMADGGLDPAFVAGAFALKASGDTSDVVESAFGWHVIRLVERIPPSAAELAARREDLVDAVMAVRVRAAMAGLLGTRRGVEPNEILGPADELMAVAAAHVL